MRLDTDLQQYLPLWFRRILDYQQLCLAEGDQLEALADAMEAVYDDLFFQTMDESAVRQWEQVFSIVPDPTVETLEFRRQRLISHISSRPPFTLRFLERWLDALVGEEKWTVEMDYANYTLYIEMAVADQLYAQEIDAAMDRIKPAHIVYIQRPFLASGMLLSHQINIGEAVYNYQLGAWALGRLPFAAVQDRGVILMPEQPSIQPTLLSDTAGFVAGDVASVRLNGTVTIPGSALTKTQDGGTVTIEYAVIPEQTPAVSRIELLNAAGDTLTDAPVYVRIRSEVRFKHRVNVKEGQ